MTIFRVIADFLNFGELFVKLFKTCLGIAPAAVCACTFEQDSLYPSSSSSHEFYHTFLWTWLKNSKFIFFYIPLYFVCTRLQALSPVTLFGFVRMWFFLHRYLTFVSKAFETHKLPRIFLYLFTFNMLLKWLLLLIFFSTKNYREKRNGLYYVIFWSRGV